MAGSTKTKNQGGRTLEKPSEKHEMAKPSSVFHEVFLKYGHRGFFVEVDIATQREYKHIGVYRVTYQVGQNLLLT